MEFPSEFFSALVGYIPFFFAALQNPGTVQLKPKPRKSESGEAVGSHSEVEPDPRLFLYAAISIFIGYSLQNAIPYRTIQADFPQTFIVVSVLWIVLAVLLLVILRSRISSTNVLFLILSAVLQVTSVSYVVANTLTFLFGVLTQASVTIYFFFVVQAIILPLYLVKIVIGLNPSGSRKFLAAAAYLIGMIFVGLSMVVFEWANFIAVPSTDVTIVARAEIDAYSGPDRVIFPAIATIEKDDRKFAIGRTVDGRWLLADLTGGAVAWVERARVDVTGDPNGLPIQPTPTETPMPSSTNTLIPTETPSPTFTNTPNPTLTYTPTETPTSTATYIPSPTPIFVGPVSSNGEWESQNIVHTFEYDLYDDAAVDTEVVMVLVPKGKFEMGPDTSFPYDLGGRQTFDEPFWIDQTEVTWQQYVECWNHGPCGDGPRRRYTQDAPRPVVAVRWFEAKTYCEWREARLPTEAEWEYAARGPDGRTYPWEGEFDATKLVFANNAPLEDGFVRTAPPKSRGGDKSWVGAYDMAGNAREWTSSLFWSYPYDATDGRENDNDTQSERVVRGGSISFTEGRYLKLPFRHHITSKTGESVPFDLGFRCARNFLPEDLSNE